MTSPISSPTQSHSLPIFKILHVSWKLFKRNPVFWVALSVAVHFISLIETWSAWEATILFLDQFLGINVPNYMTMISARLPSFVFESFAQSTKELFISIVSFILLQLVVAQIVYHVLSKRIYKLRFGETMNLLENGLLMNFFRTVAVTIVYLMALALVMLVLLAGMIVPVLVLLPFKSIVELITVIEIYIFIFVGWFVVAFVAMIYGAARWGLAEAVMVNENKGVFRSFVCSWRYTSSCRLKLFVLVTTVIGFFLALDIGLVSLLAPMDVQSTIGDIQAELPPGVKMVMFVRSIVQSLVFAIVYSVCYYWVRNGEQDWDNIR